MASRDLLGMVNPGVDSYFCFPPVLLKETKSRFKSWHCLFEDSTAPIFCGRQLSFCQFICGHQPYLCGHIIYIYNYYIYIYVRLWQYKVIRKLDDELDQVGLYIEVWSLPKPRLWYRKDKALKHSVSFGTRHFLMGGRDPLYGSTRNPQSTQYFTFVW